MKLIKKNADGYNYKYVNLEKIHEYLEMNGLDYYQSIETCEANGHDYIITHLIVEGEEQEPHRGCRIEYGELKNNSNPAQAQGSGITYARRYSLQLALGLCAADDDGESLSMRDDMNEPITKAQIKTLEVKAKEYGLKLDPKVFGKDKVEDMTRGDYGKALTQLASINK